MNYKSAKISVFIRHDLQKTNNSFSVDINSGVHFIGSSSWYCYMCSINCYLLFELSYLLFGIYFLAIWNLILPIFAMRNELDAKSPN